MAVVIAAFDAAPTVERAVHSAWNAGASEVVVIDDGSRDATGERARAAGAHVVRQSNAGASRARERGVELVGSTFLVFLDADDELLRSGVHAALQLAKSTSGPGVVASYVPLLPGGTRGATVLPWQEGVSFRSLLDRGRSPAPPASVLWRRSAFLETKVAAPPALAPRWAEDYEHLLRGAALGDWLVSTVPMALYQTYGGKSDSAPLRSLQASEDIRRYYADDASMTIRERSNRDLRALAILRTASARGGFSRVFHVVRASVRSPQLFARLIVDRARRRSS